MVFRVQSENFPWILDNDVMKWMEYEKVQARK